MSKKLLLNFDNNFYQMVDSATYINNRRWDILLKNNINLLLPEKKIPEAIKNYKKIYDTFSNKDLKNIQSVDLRLKKQAIIKYKAFND
jgi:cell division septal protein FtsQ